MSLRTSSVIPSLTTPSLSYGAPWARASEPQLGGSVGNPMRQLPVAMFALVAASLVMALMVAVAAMAMELPSAPVWRAGDARFVAPDSGDWCKTLNGRTICVGEPN